MAALRLTRLTLAVLVAGGFASAPATALTTLHPGESSPVAAGTTTPSLPPKLDLVLLFDTTGSMGGEVTNAKNGASTMYDTVRADAPEAAFGVAGFEDYPVDPYGIASDLPYSRLTDLTEVKTEWQTAVNALTVDAGSGNDTPESQVPALYALSTGSSLAWTGGSTPGGIGITWRANAAHVVVLVSDAAFHNDKDGNHAYSGLTTPTYAEALAGLTGDGSRVIAIDSGTAPDPPTGTGSHADMTAIAADTAGSRTLIPDTGVGLQQAALAALDALTYDVSSVVGCDPLDVGLEPAGATAVAHETAFDQTATIAVPADVSAGELPTEAPLDCTISYRWGDVTIGSFSEQVQVVLPSTIDVEGKTTKRKLKATGALLPAHDDPEITVTLQRKRQVGYRDIAQGEAQPAPGGYKIRFDRPQPGRCRVIAKFAGDAGHDPSEATDKLRC